MRGQPRAENMGKCLVKPALFSCLRRSIRNICNDLLWFDGRRARHRRLRPPDRLELRRIHHARADRASVKTVFVPGPEKGMSSLPVDEDLARSRERDGSHAFLRKSERVADALLL